MLIELCAMMCNDEKKTNKKFFHGLGEFSNLISKKIENKIKSAHIV